jgi:hypothetical protein
MVITCPAVQPPQTPGVITAAEKRGELTVDEGRKIGRISFEPGVQSRQTLLNNPPKGCVAGIAVFEPCGIQAARSIGR